MFRGERLKIHPVTLVPDDPAPESPALGVHVTDAGLPGEITATKRAVQVVTGSALVQLGMVQPHGKKPMPAADWARGVRIELGEVLGDE